MKNKFVGLLAIIFGIVIIAFPVLKIINTSDLFGLCILLISIVVILNGISIMDYNKFSSIVYCFIGIVMLIVSLIIIFNPTYFTFLATIIVYLGGIYMMVLGLVGIISNRDEKYGFYAGIFSILIGIIYIVIGTYVHDPLVLGILIGIWLLITGVLMIADG